MNNGLRATSRKPSIPPAMASTPTDTLDLSRVHLVPHGAKVLRADDSSHVTSGSAGMEWGMCLVKFF